MPKRGYKQTPEHRSLLSKAASAKNIRLHIVPPSNKGKRFSQEHRRKISEALKGRSTRGSGWKMSTEQRLKMSESRRGDKSPFWKGGLTPINKLIRGSVMYRDWRTSVFKRDGYACVWCGVRSGNGKAVELHPHHIKPFAYFPECRFDICNGITLCQECHKKTDSYAYKVQRLFGYKRSVWQ